MEIVYLSYKSFRIDKIGNNNTISVKCPEGNGEQFLIGLGKENSLSFFDGENGYIEVYLHDHNQKFQLQFSDLSEKCDRTYALNCLLLKSIDRLGAYWHRGRIDYLTKEPKHLNSN